MSAPSDDHEYYAPLRMGVELFEGSSERSRRGSSSNSIYRSSWQDTIWVETFEDTQSRFDFAQGFVSTELEKGSYHYELQLGRAGSTRETQSRKRDFSVPKYQDQETGSLFLMSDVSSDDSQFNATLLNYGSNVLYGQDFSLLILLPKKEHVDPEKINVKVQRLRSSGDRLADEDPRFDSSIEAEDFIYLHSPSLSKENKNIVLSADVANEGIRYAHIKIPNSNFENTRFRITVTADDSDTPLASKTVNSRWIDMPISLYNLDVAIDMMKFIVDDDTMSRLNRGSATDRERKFREFWAERDPDPETEYNELMAEYFSRIDYAYKNFSTMQRPGYETDQGRAYIIYGEPRNVERRYPTNAPTREVWEYRNRTLIFEATTGFGDFRLVSES